MLDIDTLVKNVLTSTTGYGLPTGYKDVLNTYLYHRKCWPCDYPGCATGNRLHTKPYDGEGNQVTRDVHSRYWYYCSGGCRDQTKYYFWEEGRTPRDCLCTSRTGKCT